MATISEKLNANKRFDFELKGGSFNKDTFAVINMHGVESISRPFQFTLTLVSDKANIDFDEALSGSATLHIFSPDAETSIPYCGVLSEFEQLHSAGGYMFYRAVLVPRLWKLSQYQISEVYLDKTAPEMIKGILNNSQLFDVDLKLAGSYRERSYVCQYQESHLDFVSRWMEKEGMYYYFDHNENKDHLVIVDAKIMQPAKTVKVNYRPADDLDTGQASDSVQGFICRQKPLSKKVVLQDYNYRKANVALRVEETISEKGTGDVMLYGENFRDTDEGKRYAKIRADEIRCASKVFYGESTAIGLRSGYLMQMARHFRDDFNDSYLITEITHEGSQVGALLNNVGWDVNRSIPASSTILGLHPSLATGDSQNAISYRNTFRAIPASIQFRAERITTKPCIVGTMNATIDAEGSGQYAELDEYGQYKVQLPFDQTDKSANKSSARVRMVTPYSGDDHGMHFPLHKNAEVLLSFINGDPDQPIIMGAVPNSENKNMVNQNNPSQSVIQTKGGNAIVMDDKEGRQLMYTKAPGDFKLDTLGNYFLNVEGANEQIYEGDSLQTVAGAAQSIVGGLYTSALMLGSLVSRLGFVHNINVGAYVHTKNYAPYIWTTTTANKIEKTDTASIVIEKIESAPEITATSTAQKIEKNDIASTSIKKSESAPEITTTVRGSTIFVDNQTTGAITVHNESSNLEFLNQAQEGGAIGIIAQAKMGVINRMTTAFGGTISTATQAQSVVTNTEGEEILTTISGVSVEMDGEAVTAAVPAAKVSVLTVAEVIIRENTGLTNTTYNGNVSTIINGVSKTQVDGAILTTCNGKTVTCTGTSIEEAEEHLFL